MALARFKLVPRRSESEAEIQMRIAHQLLLSFYFLLFYTLRDDFDDNREASRLLKSDELLQGYLAHQKTHPPRILL